MNDSAMHADGSRRSVRVISSVLAAGALVAGGMAATTTSADAATNSSWNRLAGCESGGNWHINTGNGYYGGLQFSASTWRGYGGGKFASVASQAKRWEQIVIAERVLRGQGWGAWPACSASLGLSSADARAKWEGRPSMKITSMRKGDADASRNRIGRMARHGKESAKLVPLKRQVQR